MLRSLNGNDSNESMFRIAFTIYVRVKLAGGQHAEEDVEILSHAGLLHPSSLLCSLSMVYTAILVLSSALVVKSIFLQTEISTIVEYCLIEHTWKRHHC